MDLLRFITAGNVDDGKSTLIGRLLYDSNAISLDILNSIEKSSKQSDKGVDLSLLTDGLRAEREQGITIDVAYKYFTTPKRKFIIADAPGHVQYTRNMVTGASNCDLTILLVDARNGVTEQTRRHGIISSLLGIPKAVVAINKMDLVNYNESTFENIKNDFLNFSSQLNFKEIYFIPVSAYTGDNVVSSTKEMKWFKGKSLLEYLENVDISTKNTFTQTRFQVQYVIRPQTDEFHDYRGYAGKLNSGKLFVGQKIKVYPAGLTSVISTIEVAGKKSENAIAGQSLVLQLKDDIDISRGDTILNETDELEGRRDFEAILCWMSENNLKAGGKYILQHNSKRTRVLIQNIIYKIDVNSGLKDESISYAGLNDIIKVQLRTAENLWMDDYTENRTNGAFILIDETSHSTVAAGMNEKIEIAHDPDFD